MKTVKLVDSGNFKAKAVIGQVLGLAPQGVDLDQMRQRIKVLDALEKADEELTLEDASYVVLSTALNAFPFQIVNKDLLAVIEGALTLVEKDEAK